MRVRFFLCSFSSCIQSALIIVLRSSCASIHSSDGFPYTWLYLFLPVVRQFPWSRYLRVCGYPLNTFGLFQRELLQIVHFQASLSVNRSKWVENWTDFEEEDSLSVAQDWIDSTDKWKLTPSWWVMIQISLKVVYAIYSKVDEYASWDHRDLIYMDESRHRRRSRTAYYASTGSGVVHERAKSRHVLRYRYVGFRDGRWNKPKKYRSKITLRLVHSKAALCMVRLMVQK